MNSQAKLIKIPARNDNADKQAAVSKTKKRTSVPINLETKLSTEDLNLDSSEAPAGVTILCHGEKKVFTRIGIENVWLILLGQRITLRQAWIQPGPYHQRINS